MFTVEELAMLGEAIERKIWSLEHIGMSREHPRRVAFRALRDKVLRAKAAAEHEGADR